MPFTVANELKHDNMRTNPSRPKFLLRQAVQDSGLKVLGWEYRVDGENYVVWYDAAVQLADGRTAFIFLYDYKAKKPPVPGQNWKPYNYIARQRKLEYAREHGHPFLEVAKASHTRMRAQIELWLMTLGKLPQREANPRMMDSQTIRRPKRTQRVG